MEQQLGDRKRRGEDLDFAGPQGARQEVGGGANVDDQGVVRGAQLGGATGDGPLRARVRDVLEAKQRLAGEARTASVPALRRLGAAAHPDQTAGGGEGSSAISQFCPPSNERRMPPMTPACTLTASRPTATDIVISGACRLRAE